MAGVNKVILLGNLGADPEVRYTASGLAVVKFRLATTDRRSNKEGAKEPKTEWHKIVAFGKLAEICGEYLSKGKQVYLEGRIQYSDWEDKDGVKRYTTEIIADTLEMLGSKGGGGAPMGGSPSSSPAPSSNSDLDDVPF